KSKILIQKLNEIKIEWDTVLPEDLLVEAKVALSDLDRIEEITVPLLCFDVDIRSIEIYSDASSVAYGVVAYVLSNNNIRHFLMSKSRIAPLRKKKLTIPQLELIAAAYAVELYSKIQESFINVPVTFFSDSQVTIKRLSLNAHRQPIFVRNRISKILKA